jgi:hypothetical protein
MNLVQQVAEAAVVGLVLRDLVQPVLLVPKDQQAHQVDPLAQPEQPVLRDLKVQLVLRD